MSYEWKPVGVDHNDDPLYDVAALAAEPGMVRRDLPQGGVLLVRVEDEFLVDFACFQFGQSEVNGSNARHTLLFHGSGPSGPLRECRHVYWGRGDECGGYVFYLPFALVKAALTALEEWFDG